jgi:sodium/bile acid cotransporter 7
MRLRIDGFVLALIIAIIIAYLFPQLVTYRDGKPVELISTVGVSLIFFFYGLKLSFSEIKDGLKNWRLHVVVQAMTFLLFPLLILLFKPFIQSELQEHFWLSFFFLATLPSTVSSSVVMVSIARGNIPAAILNASISGLIGVLLTPIWMSLFLDFETNNVFGEVYWGLIREIIIPVVMGLSLQHYLGQWARKYSQHIAKFDKAVILLIVYVSFADSFLSGVFETVSSFYLTMVFVCSITLFFVVYGLIYFFARYVMKFSREDQITAVFCGSKKSLTHGSVFGKFIFVNNPNIGLYFLPLMIFHAFQIFVITVIAQRLNRSDQRSGSKT